MKTPSTATRWTCGALATLCAAVIGGASGASPSVTPSGLGAEDRAYRVVDAAEPGDDLPPRGRSLFDHLIAQSPRNGAGSIVPFPFSALLRRVDTQMRSDATSPTKAVLIPLGRSLQRSAAAPDYFAHPRAVAAADGESATTASLYVKDRLYLGYQEKASVLEVISYNESAGRFEFQIVTDYRAGGAMRVVYANRVLCMACHQSGGPIFSRPAWDETNANPRVAASLSAYGNGFYGIPVDRGIDVPNAIDDAVLRANGFGALQLVWNDGCGGVDWPAIRCRAALFQALLQYRLSGRQQFDRDDAGFRTEAAPRVIATAQRRWPGGIALGNPDIPNRNPLSSVPIGASIDAPDVNRSADVAEAFDPLTPRAPLESWHLGTIDDASRVVLGLSEFIAEPDVRELDAALYARASSAGAPRRDYRAACRVERRPAPDGPRLEFRCASANDATRSGVSAVGRLILSGGRVATGAIDRLEIDGQPVLRDLDLAVQRTASRATQSEALLAVKRGALRARTAEGNALERFELRWDRSDGNLRLTIIEDFSLARQAIDALARDSAARAFDGFDAGAFRRARLMPALFARVGAAAGEWCCVDDARLPKAELARVDAGLMQAVAESHAPFYRYCGECHLNTERTPPNFLLGDARAVEAKLKHCAPRMLVRLGMWRREAGGRAKTPMPPEVALHRFEVGVPAWRDGDALAALLRAVDARLKDEGSDAASIDALLARGYENLRACLPDESTSALPQLPAGAAQTGRGTS